MAGQLISHVILGTNDVPRATEFYDQVLAVLGQKRRWHGEAGAGYGDANDQGIDTFWINRPLDGRAATVGNGTNVCFVAPSREAVDRFHEVALSLGADDEGGPGLRTGVHPDFYACYLRDLDGNKIVAACHRNAEQGGP
jgi:catechol 2,3-dioxygenase-like lactoylglutathione lyase family enzyme